MQLSDPPPITALFEVVFDQKVGYTIGWKRAHPEINLDGVEFKCLPSGLHEVKEDLVYFVHTSHAGVSAFVREEADAQHRNAKFIAIGALVPLTYGRLGKSWIHAAQLRQLAKDKVRNGHDCRALELFWLENKQDEAVARAATPTSPSISRTDTMPFSADSNDRKRKRARSDASGHLSSSAEGLTVDHPALAMADLLTSLGPLIFPLHRAALLRKRILLLVSAPVQQSNNFVYNLSILSGIPQFLVDSLQTGDAEALLRIQTLFSVGVHDIPLLMDSKRQRRWLASTTDDILGEKRDLYDILVKFPQQSSLKASQYPRILTSSGEEIKATQRDLRRYRLLRAELDRATISQSSYQDDPDESNDSEEDTLLTPIVRASTERLLGEVKPTADPGDHLVCEPVSWTAMAYNGFMWWASAGEMEAWENEEVREDRELFEEIPEASDLLRHMHSEPFSAASVEQAESEEPFLQLKLASATVLTAYFHRLTGRILQPLANLVEDADDETVEGVANDEAILILGKDDVRTMGLDVWSATDREFVTQAADLYFARKAKVEEGQGVRICGVRVC